MNPVGPTLQSCWTIEQYTQQWLTNRDRVLDEFELRYLRRDVRRWEDDATCAGDAQGSRWRARGVDLNLNVVPLSHLPVLASLVDGTTVEAELGPVHAVGSVANDQRGVIRGLTPDRFRASVFQVHEGMPDGDVAAAVGVGTDRDFVFVGSEIASYCHGLGITTD